MLVLILLGGGAAVAYVVLFQKKDPEVVPAAAFDGGVDDQKGSATKDDVETPKKPDKKRDKGDKKTDQKSEPKAETKAETKAEAKAETKAEGSGTDSKTTKATKTVAIAEKATPAQISDVAKKAEASGDWDTALVAYQRLEKAKGYKFPGYAVYKQALMYFQLNDTANAQAFSEKASKMPGNQKNDAKMLYADVLFKQGDYQRAKDFYIALRKQMPDKKAELAKKIARCNEKLKKPEHDGIAN
jgi:lipopolysaccharide biosynthesis regulator YciM